MSDRPVKRIGVALVENAEALRLDVASRSMALDRIAPFRGIVGDVDPRLVGHEAGAVLVHQGDLAEQIEQLGLRLIDVRSPR